MDRQAFLQGAQRGEMAFHAVVAAVEIEGPGTAPGAGEDRQVFVAARRPLVAREEVAHLEARAGVVALSILGDRSMVAAVLDDRRIVLWDFSLHRHVMHFDSPDRSRLNAIASSKDGRLVAAGGAGRSIDPDR